MFTTIAKLRNSSAQQSRVGTVESWLKKQNEGYTPDVKFPIAFIAHSNAVADVGWVNDSQNTHVAWPELANEVLKEFGHKTQTEHREEIENMLNRSKSSALTEIVAKYNAAFARTIKADFGSAWWPFPVSAPAVAATPAEVAQTPVVETNVNESTVAEKSKEQANEESETPEVETANPQLLGAMYIGLGKVMVDKQKTLAEAAKWSTSPTGGRVFSDYVHAFASGVDLKEVRATLKKFASTLEDDAERLAAASSATYRIA